MGPVDQVQQGPGGQGGGRRLPGLLGSGQVGPLLCLELGHLPDAALRQPDHELPGEGGEGGPLPEVVGALVGGGDVLHPVLPPEAQHRTRRLRPALLGPVLVILELLRVYGLVWLVRIDPT